MSLISDGCTSVVASDVDVRCCQPCQDIGGHKRLTGVMECVRGEQKVNAPLRNYGIGGLIEKDRVKRSQIDKLTVEIIRLQRNGSRSQR